MGLARRIGLLGVRSVETDVVASRHPYHGTEAGLTYLYHSQGAMQVDTTQDSAGMD